MVLVDDDDADGDGAGRKNIQPNAMSVTSPPAVFSLVNRRTHLSCPSVRPSAQAAGDLSPLPPLRIRLGDDDEWEEMMEDQEEWLDENGHKLVERVVGRARNHRGQCVVTYSPRHTKRCTRGLFLVLRMQCHGVDMALDAPKISC